MPTVVFQPEAGKLYRKTIPTPKRMSNLECWYRDAQRSIPQAKAFTLFQLKTLTTDLIVWELHHCTSKTPALLTVHRKVDTL